MKKINTGFSLIELVTTLAIVAILMSFGAPGFANFIKNNRLTTNANQLISAMNIARSEAIKRGSAVNVCSSNDQATCTGSAWNTGWVVITAGGELIRAFGATKGTVTLTNTGGNLTIQYTSRGALSGATNTFQLCDDRSGETGRTISILATGRSNVGDLTCS